MAQAIQAFGNSIHKMDKLDENDLIEPCQKSSEQQLQTAVDELGFDLSQLKTSQFLHVNKVLY